MLLSTGWLTALIGSMPCTCGTSCRQPVCLVWIALGSCGGLMGNHPGSKPSQSTNSREAEMRQLIIPGEPRKWFHRMSTKGSPTTWQLKLKGMAQEGPKPAWDDRFSVNEANAGIRRLRAKLRPMFQSHPALLKVTCFSGSEGAVSCFGEGTWWGTSSSLI